MKAASVDANSDAHRPASRKEESKMTKVERTNKSSGKAADFTKELRGIRAEHREEMRNLKNSLKSELGLLKKKFDEELKKEKDSNQKVYERQKLMLQRDQEMILKGQLKEVIRNYSDLTSNYQRELEKIRKIQHEHDSTMRKKEDEIAQLKLELAKSASELQSRRMIMQLAERNAMIEQLQSRIEELGVGPRVHVPADEVGLDSADVPDDLERMRNILIDRQMTEKKMNETYEKAIGDGHYGPMHGHQPDNESANDGGQEENDSPSYAL